MTKIISILLVTAMSLSFTSANETPDTNKTKNVKPVEVPTFHFTTIADKKITITQTDEGLSFPTLKDKNSVILFYIHTGSPCRKELQLFTKLKPKHSDLEFITFELKGLAPDKFKAFQDELGIKGLNMIDSKQAMPFAQYIAQRAQWKGSVPLLLISDKKGTLKHMQLGAMNEEQIEEILKKL